MVGADESTELWGHYEEFIVFTDVHLKHGFCTDNKSSSLLKWLSPATVFIVFFFSAVNSKTFSLEHFCRRWLDSNRRPLVSGATALPTEPQPLPLLKRSLPGLYHVVFPWNREVSNAKHPFCFCHSRWLVSSVFLSENSVECLLSFSLNLVSSTTSSLNVKISLNFLLLTFLV